MKRKRTRNAIALTITTAVILNAFPLYGIMANPDPFFGEKGPGIERNEATPSNAVHENNKQGSASKGTPSNAEQDILDEDGNLMDGAVLPEGDVEKEPERLQDMEPVIAEKGPGIMMMSSGPILKNPGPAFKGDHSTDFSEDFIVLNSGIGELYPDEESNITEIRDRYVFFENELTDEDIELIGGWDNVKLEFHFVDDESETYYGIRKRNGEGYYEDSALGIAGNFAAVADTIDVSAHMNGNMLCRILNGQSRNFGSNGVEELYVITDIYNDPNVACGSFRTNPLVLGRGMEIGFEDNGNAFGIRPEGGNWFQKINAGVLYYDPNGMFIDIDSVMEHAENISDVLSEEETANISVSYSNPQSIENSDELINVAPGTVGVYNVTAADLAKKYNGDYRFQGLANASAVMNIDCSGVTQLRWGNHKVFCDIDHGFNERYVFNGKLILNFVNAEGCEIIFDNAAIDATVLAPGASVTTYQNIDGSIIAEYITIGGEMHRNDYRGDLPGDEPEPPTEPETDPTEPETEPTVPETEPTEPETEPTEPETDPTEPETEPTQPETRLTIPETEPSVPATDPSIPETHPTEPVVTEPETSPAIPETGPDKPTSSGGGGRPTEPETPAPESETEPDTTPETSPETAADETVFPTFPSRNGGGGSSSHREHRTEEIIVLRQMEETTLETTVESLPYETPSGATDPYPPLRTHDVPKTGARGSRIPQTIIMTIIAAALIGLMSCFRKKRW